MEEGRRGCTFAGVHPWRSTLLRGTILGHILGEVLSLGILGEVHSLGTFLGRYTLGAHSWGGTLLMVTFLGVHLWGGYTLRGYIPWGTPLGRAHIYGGQSSGGYTLGVLGKIFFVNEENLHF